MRVGDGSAVVRKVITEELSRYADTRIVGAADVVPPEAMTHSILQALPVQPKARRAAVGG